MILNALRRRKTPQPTAHILIDGLKTLLDVERKQAVMQAAYTDDDYWRERQQELKDAKARLDGIARLFSEV